MWKFFGCSVRGSSHIRDELPCQDSSLLAVFPNGELLAVASDGAGSARLSDVGSKLVCTTLLEEVTAFLEDGGNTALLTADQIDLWFDAIVQRIRLQAKAADAEPRDLAATLVAALISPQGSAFMQLGDGAIVIATEEVFSPLFWAVETVDFAAVSHARHQDPGYSAVLPPKDVCRPCGNTGE